MGFDPYALDCPVHRGPAIATPEGRCPVCDADLSPLVRWRLHAADLYNRALAAGRSGQTAAARAMAEESLSFAPDLAEAEALLAELQGRPAPRVAPPRRFLLGGLGLAGLAVLAALGGGYRLGRANTPAAEVVRVPVTVVVTATAAPTPTPAGQAQLPTPTPTATPLPCPGLVAEVQAAWGREPGLALAVLQAEAEGCRVRIIGEAPTAYLLAQAEAAARQAGAEAVDTRAVVLTQRYEVRAGDSLWALAGLLYGDHRAWRAIYAANAAALPDPGMLPIGARLTLPASAAG